MDEMDNNIATLVRGLARRLGRLPTEDEVMDFIIGTNEERDVIWNKEVQ